MKVAIISDSHYSVDKVRQLLAHLKKEGITFLIHAGDFIGTEIERVFAEYPEISSWVARGNCDIQGNVIDSLNRLPHITVGDMLRFDIESVSFLVGHIPSMIFSELDKAHADVAIHGHTHVPRIDTYRETLLLNPGSLMDGDGFMILEIPELSVNRYFKF